MSGISVVNHADGHPMRVAPIVGLAFAVLIAGCSSSNRAPPGAQPPSAAEAVAPVASPPPAPSTPAQAAATPSGTALPEPANPPAKQPATASQSAVKPAPPAAKAPAVAAKAPAAQAPKSIAPDVAKKSSPTLDLTSLEQRLKDTNAIGVLTKIALKNQVDDLLDQFRAFYQGKLKTTLAELRRPYDLLVLKVLALLQDSDPPLASAIAASREAIWDILADRAKFATVS
ncbi:MAG TPA: hypothetical protein VN326_07410 [Casimicrobiaceae bacterium]|jgi:hypothetical protein|nr:hypothetical protein [Casimicrobiaceae bacterium]